MLLNLLVVFVSPVVRVSSRLPMPMPWHSFGGFWCCRFFFLLLLLVFYLLLFFLTIILFGVYSSWLLFLRAVASAFILLLFLHAVVSAVVSVVASDFILPWFLIAVSGVVSPCCFCCYLYLLMFLLLFLLLLILSGFPVWQMKVQMATGCPAVFSSHLS